MNTESWPLVVALVGGLAGSLHCLGMCGGFAAILGRGPRPRGRQAAYNAGRVASLTLLGALCGGLGAALVATGPAVFASRVLAVIGGGLMVVVGIEALGWPTRLGRGLASLATATVGRVLAPILRSPSPLAPFAFGVLNAFLPCHLVWAFAAQAATTASPLAGAAVMLAFGAGTVPALVFAGAVGRRLAGGWSWVGGLLVIAVGLLTVGRGIAVLPGHLDHGQHPGGQHQLHQ